MLLLEYSEICPFKWSKNIFSCFYCEEQFSDPTLLTEHNSSKHNSPSSRQLKEAMSTLRKYEIVKVESSNLTCRICSDIAQDLVGLNAHLSDKHEKKIDWKCNDSVLPFKMTKSDFHCALCNASFEEFKTLNQHMNVHFQKYICDQCGNGFITPERLRSHLNSHKSDSMPCDECGKVFRSSFAKKEHHALVHMQVKRHRCPHCPESFRNYFQRNKHITSVHGFKVKEFKCNLCPKVFKSSGKLGLHIKTVHMKMKRHACEICEWKFYSKSELKDHMVRHNGEKKHQCTVCRKAYARKYTLREHMRIHENDRRFVCTSCGKAFVQNCSLKHHIKVHHPVDSGDICPNGKNHIDAT